MYCVPTSNSGNRLYRIKNSSFCDEIAFALRTSGIDFIELNVDEYPFDFFPYGLPVLANKEGFFAGKELIKHIEGNGGKPIKIAQ